MRWAEQFGATQTVNARLGDPVELIRELTGGFGADVVTWYGDCPLARDSSTAAC